MQDQTECLYSNLHSKMGWNLIIIIFLLAMQNFCRNIMERLTPIFEEESYNTYINKSPQKNSFRVDLKNSASISTYSTQPSKYSSHVRDKVSLSKNMPTETYKPYSPIVKLSNLRWKIYLFTYFFFSHCFCLFENDFGFQ